MKIKIAEDFTDTPGGRNRCDGKYSGEEFREDRLIPALNQLCLQEELIIDFDGAYGYPTSFLEEAFGGLARKYPEIDFSKKLKLISTEEPSLIKEIEEYMNNAK